MTDDLVKRLREPARLLMYAGNEAEALAMAALEAADALERLSQQAEPLTAQQLDALIERHCGGTELTDGEYSSMVMFAASVERAHGIVASQPAQPCSHHSSLAVYSAETGEYLCCELCDCRSARRDAEQREQELLAEGARLREQVALLLSYQKDIEASNGRKAS
jgi:hypothetical protein